MATSTQAAAWLLPGLLLYLRGNEGSGTQTADAAALGGNTMALLSNGVTWAASTASVGGLFASMADSLLIDTNNNGKANANDTQVINATGGPQGSASGVPAP